MFKLWALLFDTLWWMVYWFQPWRFHDSIREQGRKGCSFCGFHIYLRCSTPESTHSPSWAWESRELDEAAEPVLQLPLMRAVFRDSMAFCQKPKEWVMRQSRNQKNVQVIPDENFVFWLCCLSSSVGVGGFPQARHACWDHKNIASKNNSVFVHHTIITLTQKTKAVYLES